MWDVPNIIIMLFLFISVFFEVFLLLTLLENRSMFKNKAKTPQVYFPTATIVVPCYNEEESIFGTVDSLLALDYPKDKYKIMIIDDGSTDNSWNLMQKYQDHPMIEIFTKKNGGKHTVLNFAIAQSKSDIIGCLDADSFVSPNALKDIALHFYNEKVMAVTPAVKIYNPDNILRKVQKVEYDWGIFLRKMLSFLDALYVTPGPFSFFRREVFEKLGPYREAHNTEDMEIAMRLQSNGYKITNCHTAFVFTIAPDKFYKLFIQRIRWTYGFLKNAIDYKHLFFNRAQGNLGFFILPVMIVSALSTLWMTGFFLFKVGSKTRETFTHWQSINFDFLSFKHMSFNPEWFYLNTSVISLIAIVSFVLMITFVLLGRKISDGKIKFRSDLLYFFAIYPFIAPTWLIKSVYNILISKKAVWR